MSNRRRQSALVNLPVNRGGISVNALAADLLEVIALAQPSAKQNSSGGVTVYSRNRPVATTAAPPPRELDSKTDLYE